MPQNVFFCNMAADPLCGSFFSVTWPQKEPNGYGCTFIPFSVIDGAFCFPTYLTRLHTRLPYMYIRSTTTSEETALIVRG